MKAFLQRSLLTHYLLFFSGTLVVVYQIQNMVRVGDALHILCALSFIAAYFTTHKKLHVLENAGLITLGYLIPVTIQNLVLLSKTSLLDMIQHLAIAGVTAFVLSSLFSYSGYFVAKIMGSLKSLSVPPGSSLK